jgi:hypothetical protein
MDIDILFNLISAYVQIIIKSRYFKTLRFYVAALIILSYAYKAKHLSNVATYLPESINQG